MALQRVLPRESLATAAVTVVGFFSCVSLSMPFQVVLSVERQCAQIA